MRIATALLIGATMTANAQESNSSKSWSEHGFIATNPALFLTIKPPTVFQLSANGRTAYIDFGGDAVKYSGDLPIDESAKVFFEAVMQQYLNCLPRR